MHAPLPLQMDKLAGGMTGTSLVVDHETGFLTPGDGYRYEGFTIDKKLRFLELAPEFWPHVTRICQAVGISRYTYANHYKLDERFRELVDAARDHALDEAEAAMRSNSIRPGGFMDRIALLKAYRPERWNPEHKVSVTHDVLITKSLAQEARASIPGHLVDTTGESR